MAKTKKIKSTTSKSTTKATSKIDADVNKDGKVDEKDVKIVKETIAKEKAKKTKSKGWSQSQKDSFSAIALSGRLNATALTYKAEEILGEVKIEKHNARQVAFISTKHNGRLPENGYFSVI
tara:strand:+ start:6185 stop:6547 length:363 start_codon:yes stop_codon:yes gene_type:complete